MTAEKDIQGQISKHIDRFFAGFGNLRMQKAASKALRFLASGEKPLLGKPEGWAAGLVYYLANRDRQACGVPGMLNAEFEEFFGVTMSTVRKRAAQIDRALEI